jgi:hypothetical protein
MPSKGELPPDLQAWLGAMPAGLPHAPAGASRALKECKTPDPVGCDAGKKIRDGSVMRSSIGMTILPADIQDRGGCMPALKEVRTAAHRCRIATIRIMIRRIASHSPLREFPDS